MQKKIIDNPKCIVIPLLGVSKGGGIRVICELANGLSNRGHEIMLVTTPITNFPFPLNSKVKLLSRVKKNNESKCICILKDIFFVYRKSLKLGDIVLSNYYTSFYIGFLLQVFNKKKHIYFIQGYEPDFFEKQNNIVNKFKSLLAKLTYQIKPDLRITISNFIKDKIGKIETIIINDGIDPNIFKVSPCKKNNANKKTICSIAFTIRRKGFYDFVKAIEILSLKRSDFKILLFTSESQKEYDLSFPFEIVYPHDDFDIVHCLQKADIFVSSSHLEGFGLPGLEAMACGAVLITTNSGGITQYADDGINSIIVEVGNIDEIVAAIEKLLDQPKLLEKLRDSGIKTSKKFTWEIMCENFEKEIKKLL